MTHDTMQTNDYSEAQTDDYNEAMMETSLGEVYPISEQPLLTAAPSTTDVTEESLASFQVKAADFFENITQSAIAFFRENRQLLIKLGWIFLAFLGLKVLFVSLNAIDDVPLMSPFLKLVGLVTVVRFGWRYLVRADDRQELTQKIGQAKTELLGN